MSTERSSEGYFTETNTYFGRHYYAFHSLEKELKKGGHESLDCLIIGPGLDYGITTNDTRFVGTYQPFELANTIINSGIKNYAIEIIDINPDVIEELKKPALLKIRMISHDSNSEETRYFNSFFNKNTVHSSKYTRVVHIPEGVCSRFDLKLQNIITAELPKEKYDIVVCTVLLSHYYREITQEWNDPIPKTLKKIEDSVKPGGYLIDTEKAPLTKGWEDIFLHINYKNDISIHPENANLFRKKTA